MNEDLTSISVIEGFTSISVIYVGAVWQNLTCDQTSKQCKDLSFWPVHPRQAWLINFGNPASLLCFPWRFLAVKDIFLCHKSQIDSLDHSVVLQLVVRGHFNWWNQVNKFLQIAQKGSPPPPAGEPHRPPPAPRPPPSPRPPLPRSPKYSSFCSPGCSWRPPRPMSHRRRRPPSHSLFPYFALVLLCAWRAATAQRPAALSSAVAMLLLLLLRRAGKRARQT